MIIETRGYVFRTVKFGENNLIADVFTESNGLISFVVPGARKVGNRSKGIFLKTLSSVDLIIDFQEGKNLQRLKEVKFDRLLTHIQMDIRKGSIVLFLGEVLRNSVRENVANKELFEFIDQHIGFLEEAKKGFNNLTIYFLIHLTAHLGFFPVGEWTELNSSLNLQEGHFEPFPGNLEHNLEPLPSQLLDKLMNISLEEIETVSLTREQRVFLLEKLIWYYRYHLDYFSEIKSIQIFKEIF